MSQGREEGLWTSQRNPDTGEDTDGAGKQGTSHGEKIAGSAERWALCGGGCSAASCSPGPLDAPPPPAVLLASEKSP